MNIELSRFRVRKGKSEVVDKWMNFLNENMEEVLLTLDGERMYVETIFRENLSNVAVETIKSHLRDDENKGIVKIKEDLSKSDDE